MTAVIGNEPVDGQTLELKAETLIVTKRTVTGATVRVSTVTREVEQAVDERLDHELVDVERVPIGRVVETIPEIREEDGVTIVPVVEEVVVVERRLVLKEEVRITRRRVQSRHVETASLRRQEAVVTRIGPGESPASQSQSERQTNKSEARKRSHGTRDHRRDLRHRRSRAGRRARPRGRRRAVERHQPARQGRLDDGHVTVDCAGARAGLLGEPVRRRAGP